MTCIMIPHEPIRMTLVFGYGELFKEYVYEQVEYATQYATSNVRPRIPST